MRENAGKSHRNCIGRPEKESHSEGFIEVTVQLV